MRIFTMDPENNDFLLIKYKKEKRLSEDEVSNIFGPGTAAKTPRENAKKKKKLFV